MLLSLWLSPWGKLVDLEVYCPSVPLLSLKGIQLAVFTAQGFVTARARTSQPQSMGKKSALLATPLTEAALATLATLVQGVGD